MNNTVATESTLRNTYLDYVNNYITVETFAADYELSVTDAQTLITMGKKYHEAYVKMIKG